MYEKAKLYDKLSTGEVEHDGRFLVNFNNRDNKRDSSSDEDEDSNKRKQWQEVERDQNGDNWVEYKDSLGRTRMAMKKDLPALKLRDEDLKISVNRQNECFSEESSIDKNEYTSDNPEQRQEMSMLSEDMRRELLRQKWEKEEEENLKKTNLHYKDVLFDEARTHGAAFYNFSRSAAERASEMEQLEEMHKETEKGMIFRTLMST